MPILDIVREAVMITGFVLAMMLVIEYLNVYLKGSAWMGGIHSGRRQYLFAAVAGILPGCLGSWVVVTMYSHGLVSLGALVTAMIATSGDEAYVMLAVIPAEALWLFAALGVCGVAVGVLTDRLLKGRSLLREAECHQFEFHPEADATMLGSAETLRRWRTPTPKRLLLSVAGVVLAAVISAGYLGPAGWDWIRVGLLASCLFALFVIGTVPDHFLEEHLWGHVLRRHAARMFGWTLGALLVTQFVIQGLGLDTLSAAGKWTMLIAACLVGIIPQSGPHLVFVTLYAKGAIPISVLLASSIVQDGHGMLPLLAESRRAFVVTKAINFAAGLLIGSIALLAGL